MIYFLFKRRDAEAQRRRDLSPFSEGERYRAHPGATTLSEAQSGELATQYRLCVSAPPRLRVEIPTGTSSTMKIKKRFITLLEVLIAMGIALGLLMACLYFYRYVSYVDHEITWMQKMAFQIRMSETRLNAILSTAGTVSDRKEAKIVFFTQEEHMGLTVGPSLLFTYRNDDLFNVYYLGPVLGCLFVDPEGRLTLATWPYNKIVSLESAHPVHTEVILEGVERLSMEFLVGETDKTQFADLRPGAFLKEWRSEFDELPHGMKLFIQLKGQKEPVVLAFPLPSPQGVLKL